MSQISELRELVSKLAKPHVMWSALPVMSQAKNMMIAPSTMRAAIVKPTTRIALSCRISRAMISIFGEVLCDTSHSRRLSAPFKSSSVKFSKKMAQKASEATPRIREKNTFPSDKK